MSSAIPLISNSASKLSTCLPNELRSTVGDKIVAVKQGKYLGVSFHPELTDDYRVTQYFIDHTI
jgi:glutamine amidotransferase PdxT